MQNEIQATGKKGLVVLSGGMDSTTLLYDYLEDIGLALSFDYGSKHAQAELTMARLHCERLGIEHIIIPLSFMGQYFRSALLTSGGEIPMGDYDQKSVETTVVPFRNGIMLSISAGLAESRGLKRIYIANHFGDHALYPDCRRSFVEPMELAIHQGTTNGVDLCAPYTDMSKTDIALRGKTLGLDYSETWSCYQGGAVQCGGCATCLERKQAMREAGIADPTHYLQ